MTLKLKTADFQIRTRARSLSRPDAARRRIFDCGRELLAKEIDGTKFRLIGIGVSNLQHAEGADPGDLLDPRGAQGGVERIRASTPCAPSSDGRRVDARISLRDEETS